jgi:hypothetical protein
LQFRLKKSSALAVPALAVAAATLTGCGGGGSSSSGPATPISNQLRAYQQNDSWTYIVSGWEYRSGTPNIYVTSGSYVVGVQADPSYPVNGTMSFAHALDLKWNDNTSLTQSYVEDFVQDKNLNVYKLADTLSNTTFGTAGNIEYAEPINYTYQTVTTTNQDGTTTTTTTNNIIAFYPEGHQPYLPGTWGNSTGFSSANSYDTEFANSSNFITPSVTNHETLAITYLGQETVTVPAGTFTCWKTNMVNLYQGQNRTVNATAWWAPQLGSFVKMNTVETVSTGQQQLTYVLQKTTVGVASAARPASATH